MTASKLLEKSLDELTKKLKELVVSYPAELQPVCDALAAINSRGTETSSFRRNLKELAAAVIQVRALTGSASRLRELPVPPYDLWLPFKAKDSTTTDSEDLIEAMKIFNHKVTTLMSECDTTGAAPARTQEQGRDDAGPGGRKSEDA